MGQLKGLKEYLDAKYHVSVFDKAFESDEPWDLHVHPHQIITAGIVANHTYDVEIEGKEVKESIMPKIKIKFLYPGVLRDSVMHAIKWDKKIKELNLDSILSPRQRYHIKNKSLFPLMHERKVVFFTLLEGEMLRGIICDFSRYDVTLKLKGGMPVTILRHAVYDLRDKKGRCFLKSFQETRRDWEKSSLYTSLPLAEQIS